jgi:hypothetical protein
VDVVITSDESTSYFFFYNPNPNVPADHKFPFATIVTGDDSYDQFSNLNRPSVFRLNIGVSKQTFASLFGLPERSSNRAKATGAESDQVETVDADAESNAYGSGSDRSFDFTVLDKLIPHPVYGRMYWVSVLNPTDETLKTKVHPLLVEAYEQAVRKYNRQHAAASGQENQN